MPNLGDIAYQTVAGATSTATHGTGRPAAGAGGADRRRCGWSRPTARSSTARPTRSPRSSTRPGRRSARSGIVSTVTLQVVPAFNLRVVEEPLRVDDVLADLDAHVDGNDHFEFFWVPHTGWALTKANNRTDEPLAPAAALDAVVRRLPPRELRASARCAGSVGAGRSGSRGWPRPCRRRARSTYVDQSYRVFASPRLVRFYEMEYAIPREACAEALNRVRALRRGRGPAAQLPGRGALHRARRHPAVDGHGRPVVLHRRPRVRGHGVRAATSRASSAIMDDYDGRPHWGKLHFQTRRRWRPATRSGTRSPPCGTASIPSGASRTRTWTACSGLTAPSGFRHPRPRQLSWPAAARYRSPRFERPTRRLRCRGSGGTGGVCADR